MTPAETGETRRTMDDTPSQVKHPTTIIVDGEVKEPISSMELVYDGRSSMKGPHRRVVASGTVQHRFAACACISELNAR